jgi:hypothetical protein
METCVVKYAFVEDGGVLGGIVRVNHAAYQHRSLRRHIGKLVMCLRRRGGGVSVYSNDLGLVCRVGGRPEFWTRCAA